MIPASLQADRGFRALWVCSGDSVEDVNIIDCLGDLRLQTAAGGLECLSILKAVPCDAVIANFPLPDWTADELLEEVQRIDPMLPFLVRDRAGTLADAVRLTKLGAYHFFGPDLDSAALLTQLEAIAEYRRSRELASFGAALSQEPWRQLLVGESRALENVCHIIRLIGGKRCTVLISGETGTGKEIVARALHMASNRSHLPMVAVNCSALPENLLEAELFGHVKGAFTGAMHHRVGHFEQAHRSTIFLDEVADMPMDLQAKLLRVLQERQFQRVGSSETIDVDVRVVAASNVDLAERVRQGRFREDLFYRLNVVPVRMPPLRERQSDIPMLTHHFIQKICRMEQIPAKTAGRETMARLSVYAWPGNVRQLENAIEMAIALSGDRQALYPSDFPLPHCAKTFSPSAPAVLAVPDCGLDFEQAVNQFERSILEQALQRTSGNKKQAADMLRLKRTTLSAKLKTLEAACG